MGPPRCWFADLDPNLADTVSRVPKMPRVQWRRVTAGGLINSNTEESLAPPSGCYVCERARPTAGNRLGGPGTFLIRIKFGSYVRKAVGSQLGVRIPIE